MNNLLSWDQTLFRNHELFELDHIPEHFLHRETEMQSLLYSVKPAMQGLRPLNCLCKGQPGTGKTTAVKKMFEEIEAHTQKVVPVYVNCQMDATRYMVFSQIFRKIFGYSPPSSGVSFKKIFNEIARHIAEKEKVLIIALDDMNFLFYENEITEVLYSLLRAHEIQPGAKVGVIGILSDTGVPHVFDPKVQSVYLPEEIEFPPYTYEEIRSILSARVELGFYSNVLSDELIERIVEYTYSMHDLRVGIDLLKRAGFAAEQRADMKIIPDDVEKAFEKSRMIHLAYIIKSLKKDEAALLRLISDNNETNSGVLYEKFHSLTGLGYTRFYETLSKLDAVSLLQVDFTGKGTRGRTRVVKLRYPAEEVKKRLDKNEYGAR